VVKHKSDKFTYIVARTAEHAVSALGFPFDTEVRPATKNELSNYVTSQTRPVWAVKIPIGQQCRIKQNTTNSVK